MAATKSKKGSNRNSSRGQQENKVRGATALLAAQDADVLRDEATAGSEPSNGSIRGNGGQSEADSAANGNAHNPHSPRHLKSDGIEAVAAQEDDGHSALTLSALIDLLSFSTTTSSIAYSAPEAIKALWHVFVLLPLALWLSMLSHGILNRNLWARGGGPSRLAFPVRRCQSWAFTETATVAITSHLFDAFIKLSRTRLCPSAEKLIPLISNRLFGIKHEGLSLSGVALTLEPLPDKFAIQISSHTDSPLARTEPGVRLAAGAVLLWKSHARNVSNHAIQSFKPTTTYGGIGGGVARDGERVVLLLSGGSYADRDPLAGLIGCNLVNLAGLRTLCLNWRKPAPLSGGQDGAFPAGLNDALQAYVHLVLKLKFEPKNIFLAAESSGAGVAMGLMIWLSALARSGYTPALGRPGRVILWSPWCDLSMKSPSWTNNADFDIVSPRTSLASRDLYVSSIISSSSSSSSRSKLSTATSDDQKLQQELSSQWSLQPSESCRLLVSSLPKLGLSHPLLSPGRPTDSSSQPFNSQVLDLLSTASSKSQHHQQPTSYLIFCGRDSVFSGDASSLARNLSQLPSSPPEVKLLLAADTPTHFNLLPSSFLPRAQEKADEIVRRWLLGD